MLYRSVILSVLVVTGMMSVAAEPQHRSIGDREESPLSKSIPDEAPASQGGLAASGVSGACCLPGGSCQLVAAQADCQMLGGVFLPAESTCDNCPGACVVGSFQPPECLGGLYFDERCIDSAPDQCSTMEGSFQGAGSTCTNLMGACCFDAGCHNDVLQSDCDTNGGRFQGVGSSCSLDSNPCSGACCVFGDRCVEFLPTCFCTEFLGGTYQGDGTTCTDPDPAIACTNPRGACCLPPFLFGSVPTAPLGMRGLAANIMQSGPGPSCSYTPTGAPCCDGLTEFTCFLLSGTYDGADSSCAAATCSTAPCPGRGECCLPHRSGGCADAACCNAVCRVEPQCCLGNGLLWQMGISQPVWDSLCVATARRVCGSGVESCASCPGLGDCCQANGSGGCTEESCCREVCAVDPYCCDNEWDAFCAASAAWSCGNTCLSPGDFNGDGRVDLEDYWTFENLFTGP